MDALPACVPVSMCAYVHVCLCACMPVSVCACVHVCLCTYVPVYMCAPVPMEVRNGAEFSGTEVTGVC